MRALLVMAMVAGVAGGVGLAILLRPGAIGRAAGLPRGEGAVYALRLIGAMLAGFGLTLGCFAAAYYAATR